MTWGIRTLRLALSLLVGASAVSFAPGLVSPAGAAVQPCTMTFTNAGGTIAPDTPDDDSSPAGKHVLSGFDIKVADPRLVTDIDVSWDITHPDAGEAECAGSRSARQRVTRRAAVSSLLAADTDGDGLDDTLDGCPSVASATPTGCPSAWRKVALRWLAGARRLEARVTSPVDACASRARIKLFLDRRSGPDKLLGSDASTRGRQRFKVTGGARYYVKVSASYSPGVAECGTATSRTVAVPRS